MNKPVKIDKGKLNGSCNRTTCQKPGATWFNSATHKHYCKACALAINKANPDWKRAGFSGQLCTFVGSQLTEEGKLSAARIDEREKACRAICYHCRSGDPVEPHGQKWLHSDLYTLCDAGAIREASREKL